MTQAEYYQATKDMLKRLDLLEGYVNEIRYMQAQQAELPDDTDIREGYGDKCLTLTRESLLQ